MYDGNTSDSVTLSSDGVLLGDTVSFTNGSANFDNKNVGNGKTVTVNGITASGDDAGNYSFNLSTTTTADITPLTVTVVANGNNKVYDGTTTDSVTLASNGILLGDNVSFTNGSANFDNKNVGNGKTVTVNGITASGDDAGNYSFNLSTTTTADITPLAVTVVANGSNKVYDGTTADNVTLNSDGVLLGDNVSFTNGSANFDNKNVGNGKTVTVNGITASGGDAGNYAFNTLATTTADITPLSIFVAAQGTNKVFDGTTGDQVSLTSTGVINGDQINFNYATANFASANPVINGVVTVTGINAVGADAGNYLILDPITTATANITLLTPADISAIIAAILAKDKAFTALNDPNPLTSADVHLPGNIINTLGL